MVEDHPARNRPRWRSRVCFYDLPARDLDTIPALITPQAGCQWSPRKAGFQSVATHSTPLES